MSLVAQTPRPIDDAATVEGDARAIGAAAGAMKSTVAAASTTWLRIQALYQAPEALTVANLLVHPGKVMGRVDDLSVGAAIALRKYGWDLRELGAWRARLVAEQVALAHAYPGEHPAPGEREALSQNGAGTTRLESWQARCRAHNGEVARFDRAADGAQAECTSALRRLAGLSKSDLVRIAAGGVVLARASHLARQGPEPVGEPSLRRWGPNHGETVAARMLTLGLSPRSDAAYLADWGIQAWDAGASVGRRAKDWARRSKVVDTTDWGAAKGALTAKEIWPPGLANGGRVVSAFANLRQATGSLGVVASRALAPLGLFLSATSVKAGIERGDGWQVAEGATGMTSSGIVLGSAAAVALGLSVAPAVLTVGAVAGAISLGLALYRNRAQIAAAAQNVGGAVAAGAKKVSGAAADVGGKAVNVLKKGVARCLRLTREGAPLAPTSHCSTSMAGRRQRTAPMQCSNSSLHPKTRCEPSP